MRHSRSLVALLLLAASGCNCGDDDDGSPAGNTDVGASIDRDAEAPESGPGSTCLQLGQVCSTGTVGATCCSGNCRNGVCNEAMICKGPGIDCTDNSECCTLQCVD